MPVQPYLFFDGRCEEALEFYKKALGAEVTTLMRFEDAPVPPPPGAVAPGSENKVMHAELRVAGTTLLASDGSCNGKPVFQGMSLAVTLPSVADVERAFAALADGGRVQMPLGKTFFAERFGMLTDRFGVGWMLLTEGEPGQ